MSGDGIICWGDFQFANVSGVFHFGGVSNLLHPCVGFRINWLAGENS